MEALKKPVGYYDDLEISVEEAISNAALPDCLFYFKDQKQRKFFLPTEIEAETVGDILRHIMQINREDMGTPPEERKPILIYISCRGGSLDDGLSVIDAIENSITPVYTINIGYAYSMGFLIALAGHKRFCTKNAMFLMHDGTDFVVDSSAKAMDRLEFNKRMEDRLKQYVVSHSKITKEEYEQKYRVEWYMFAEEAKGNGFVDSIVGEDCDLTSII